MRSAVSVILCVCFCWCWCFVFAVNHCFQEAVRMSKTGRGARGVVVLKSNPRHINIIVLKENLCDLSKLLAFGNQLVLHKSVLFISTSCFNLECR